MMGRPAALVGTSRLIIGNNFIKKGAKCPSRLKLCHEAEFFSRENVLPVFVLFKKPDAL